MDGLGNGYSGLGGGFVVSVGMAALGSWDIMRWLRSLKAVVIGAAVAVGVFLSMASRAFDWSSASTFAVACALVAVLSLIGPALILFGEVVYEGRAKARSKVPSTGVSPAQPAAAQLENFLDPWMLFEPGSQRQKGNDLAYLVREKPRDLNPTEGVMSLGLRPSKNFTGPRPAALRSELDAFVALAGRSRFVEVDNAALLDDLGDALLVEVS